MDAKEVRPEVDDRLDIHKAEGVPPHVPPPELAHFFSPDGKLSGEGVAMFATRSKDNPWFKDLAVEELALYLWKICGDSATNLMRVMGCTAARARHVIQHTRAIAARRGIITQSEAGTLIYTENEDLGDDMIRTVANAHKKLQERINAGVIVETKELLEACKTLTNLGLLLQGLPTTRTAAVQEKPETEKKLRENVEEMREMFKSIGVKPDGSAASSDEPVN